MRHSSFIFYTKHCSRCKGTGRVNDRQFCNKRKSTGVEYEHDSIKIDEEILYDLMHFNSIAWYGEKSLAFVDWSQLYGFSNFEKLLDDGWIDERPDTPPLFGNHRDYFPEKMYSISAKGRIVLMRPDAYLIDESGE